MSLLQKKEEINEYYKELKFTLEILKKNSEYQEDILEFPKYFQNLKKKLLLNLNKKIGKIKTFMDIKAFYEDNLKNKIFHFKKDVNLIEKTIKICEEKITSNLKFLSEYGIEKDVIMKNINNQHESTSSL